LRIYAIVITLLLFCAGTVFAFEPAPTGDGYVNYIVTSVTRGKPIPAPKVRFVSRRTRRFEPTRVTAIAPRTRYRTIARRPVTLEKRRARALHPPKRIASRLVSPSWHDRYAARPRFGAFAEQAGAHGKSRSVVRSLAGHAKPLIKAKALFCLDCSDNKVMLAKNICQPLPIASITKLLTALVVIREMNLDQVVRVPADITKVERVVVGIRPGDLLTVKDLLHGMLIKSGNDCAEALARAYPKGGRAGFIAAMNRLAKQLGAYHTTIFTPSGLDMKIIIGRKDGRDLETRRSNTASAEDVATIARNAFSNPLISEISSTRIYTMRTQNAAPKEYHLVSNDRLLAKHLPIIGAKTGFTYRAGRCIVALFKDHKAERMVVVLNTPHHFRAAEKLYRWTSRAF
jgi:D-alanyl-D-alanine carboxypeptidase